MWHLMGVMLSAGGSFQWYRDTLGEGRSFDELTKEAAEIEPGCEGLIFLPYLAGERTPHADPHAKGVFFGLTARHTKAHLTRAVLEGVGFGLRDSLELMRDLGVSMEEIRATAGGSKSPLWLQILADIFGTKITTLEASEGAAFGAALLGGVGAGVYPDVPAACKSIRSTGETIPGTGYDDGYSRYRALYPALREEFRR